MMKLNFLKLRTARALKTKVARVNVPYKESSRVGVLFTVEDKAKHEAIKDFIKKLEHDGKSVKVIEYLPTDKQNYEFKFDFFTEKDLSFWGKITSNDALKFTHIPFDYLFYLDTEPNPLLLHLLATSKANCRVGRVWDEGKDYFEFMIECSPNLREMLDMIHKYVIQLR
jgi:hypothetical protein